MIISSKLIIATYKKYLIDPLTYLFIVKFNDKEIFHKHNAIKPFLYYFSSSDKYKNNEYYNRMVKI